MSANPYNVKKCTEPIRGRLTAEMSAILDAPFSKEEIKEALNQMALLKAPGPNGFNADFYQQN